MTGITRQVIVMKSSYEESKRKLAISLSRKLTWQISDKRHALVEVLKLDISATTREGKFRSRLQERTVLILKACCRFVLSLQDPTKKKYRKPGDSLANQPKQISWLVPYLGKKSAYLRKLFFKSGLLMKRGITLLNQSKIRRSLFYRSPQKNWIGNSYALILEKPQTPLFFWITPH